MRRYHLFEFLDQPWLPGVLRRAATEYLAAAYRLTPFPNIWARQIVALSGDATDVRIVDLGSGSGGPVTAVARELAAAGRRAQVLLTDLHPPNALPDLPDGIRYWPQPVDARSVPAELDGIRTLFAVFHHFDPAMAAAVLRDAFDRRQPVCVFEATSRTLPALVGALLIPLLVLVLMPAVRPVRWTSLLLTYLPPVLPLMIFWDGMVSQLRTYTADELLAITREFSCPDYSWEAGTIKAPRAPAPVAFLVGRPVMPR